MGDVIMACFSQAAQAQTLQLSFNSENGLDQSINASSNTTIIFFSFLVLASSLCRVKATYSIGTMNCSTSYSAWPIKTTCSEFPACELMHVDTRFHSA